MQLLIALLTIFGSGILSGLCAYLLNVKKEHVFFMRDKIEETCGAALEFVHRIGVSHRTFIDAMSLDETKSSIAFAKYLELTDFSLQLRANVQVYFPQLSALQTELQLATVAIQQHNANYIGKKVELKGVLPPEYFEGHRKLYEVVVTKLESFLEALGREGQQYVGADALRDFAVFRLIRGRTIALRS